MSSRILIIDDEESLRLTFKMFLSREGYGPVEVAATYEEALEFISRQEFDLIISDIVLEGNSGIDILRQVKESGLSCPMVMVTGYPNIESAAEAVRLGAFDYIAKPVKKDGLLRTARMALQQHALWKERSRLLAEQERNRLYLETIFRSVSDAIITLDQDLRIVDMNATARRWAKNMPEINIGASVSLLPGSCGEACVKNAARVISELTEVHEHRVECEFNGMGTRVLQINAAPLEDRNKKFHGVVLLIRDVTQLESLEKRERRARFHRLIGVSPAMQTVYTLIEHVGQVDTAVLITGESGTGKELVAEALHAESGRKEMPLIKVDCTAIAEDLLESELFGHRKGSFTGADRDREGRILQADGGTLFLDEIGDISSRMQLRLLRFLQEKTFHPVGQDRPVKVDVRVIAATNADLKRKVTQGDFREDLYFRLRVIDIILPPLRAREGDLQLLAAHFVERFSKRIGLVVTGLSDQALAVLQDYSWPGNVRELEHVIERACVLCQGATITTEHLPPEVFQTQDGNLAGRISPRPEMTIVSTNGIYPPHFEDPSYNGEEEEARIARVLRQTAGNKAMAARLLGFDRSTLYRKMRNYNIDVTTP
ncbi:MAG: sigma 54-interacting transcriptional regulator [Desulfobulbaceae bacterium]|nr:sigma 54-interacting transcriptional regulator [Desulfobulbaceae bacterium]